jgi:hypothetical protein
MAGSKVDLSGSSSATVTNIIQTLQAQRTGYEAVSLTNMSTTSVSAIAAGSVAEIGASLYGFSTEEPVSTEDILSTAAMTYAISLVPSSSIVTAHFSSLTPVWREDYCGWYESSSSINKVIALNYFNGTNYSSASKGYIGKQDNSYMSTGKYINLNVSSYATIETINNTYLSSADINTIARTSFTLSSTGDTTPLSYPSGFTVNNAIFLGGTLFISTGSGYAISVTQNVDYITFASTWIAFNVPSSNVWGDNAILYFMRSS